MTRKALKDERAQAKEAKGYRMRVNIKECPHCKREIGYARATSGKGVFNIRFAHGIEACHKVWLKSDQHNKAAA